MRLIRTAITALLVMASFNAFSQPVLTANHMPQIGMSAPMYVGANITTPGTGGANVEWDFSFQSSFDPIGVMEYMDIANTEFADSFITCNLVQRRRLGADTFYNYYIDVGSEVLIRGENMGAPLYFRYSAANPKTLFSFPMNYQDSFTDTFYSNNGNGYVIREYDGYGKLFTNFNNFNSVVRIKSTTVTFNGTAVAYDWYTTDYYFPVAHYEMNSQQMTILRMFAVSVENTVSEAPKVSLAPNPFKGQAILYVDKVVPGMKLTITNAIGQVVQQRDVTENNTTISSEALTSGVYLYNVSSKDGASAKGKFVIE